MYYGAAVAACQPRLPAKQDTQQMRILLQFNISKQPTVSFSFRLEMCVNRIWYHDASLLNDPPAHSRECVAVQAAIPLLTGAV